MREHRGTGFEVLTSWAFVNLKCPGDYVDDGKPEILEIDMESHGKLIFNMEVKPPML